MSSAANSLQIEVETRERGSSLFKRRQPSITYTINPLASLWVNQYLNRCRLVTMTGNFGNGSFDNEALEQLLDIIQFDDERKTLFIMHLQEANAENMIKELQQRLDECFGEDKFIVTLPNGHFMPTHTKPSTQLHSETGIANVIISPAEFQSIREASPTSLSHAAKQIIRRTGTETDLRLERDNNNKGGIIDRLEIKLFDYTYKIDLISAHLDSKNPVKRATDWYNIYRKYHGGQVTSFDELQEIAADTICLGMDSNFRDIAIPTSDGDNPFQRKTLWLNPSIESAAFLNVRFGGSYRSAGDTTYKPSKYHQLDKPNRRSVYGQRCFAGGLLDVLQTFCFNNHGEFILNTKHYEQQAAEFQIAPNDGPRDHGLVYGTEIIIAPSDDFTRSKNYLAQLLAGSSKALANSISALEDNDENRQRLVWLYNHYLANHLESLTPEFFKLHLRQLSAIQAIDNIDERQTYQSYFDKLSPWLSIDENWARHISQAIDPLTKTYYKTLRHKLYFQTLSTQYFEDSQKAEERRLVIAITDALLKNSVIPLSKLGIFLGDLLTLNQVFYRSMDALSDVNTSDYSNDINELIEEMRSSLELFAKIWGHREASLADKLNMLANHPPRVLPKLALDAVKQLNEPKLQTLLSRYNAFSEQAKSINKLKHQWQLAEEQRLSVTIQQQSSVFSEISTDDEKEEPLASTHKDGQDFTSPG